MNTPDHCSDDTINRLFEQLPAILGAFPLTNAETLANGRLNEKRVIDLQRRYDISVTEMPTLYRLPEFEAVDLRTFDADPESRWHLKGRGPTTCEAVTDLLMLIAAEVARG